MTKGSKRFRSVLCTAISFLLALSLTLIGVLGVLKLTVLNPDYIINLSEKSGYSAETHKELKEEFISYGSACNVDESFFDKVFDSVITEKTISEYNKSSIIDLYNGTSTDTVVDEIEEQLLEELKLYATDKGFKLDNTLLENLENMSSEMGGIFKAYTGMFNTSYFKTAMNVLNKYLGLFKWAFIGLCVFALLSVIEIRLFFAKAKNYLRYYIYATSGATLMLAVGPAAALIMKIGYRVSIANASLYGFVSGFINGMLVALLCAAAVTAVITVVLIIIRHAVIKKEA